MDGISLYLPFNFAVKLRLLTHTYVDTYLRNLCACRKRRWSMTERKFFLVGVHGKLP